MFGREVPLTTSRGMDWEIPLFTPMSLNAKWPQQTIYDLYSVPVKNSFYMYIGLTSNTGGFPFSCRQTFP